MTSHVSQSIPSRSSYALWEKIQNLKSHYGQNVVVKEVAQLAGSIFCGYVGTKLVELPINAFSKSLNVFNIVDRNGWIYLNAPGIAAIGGTSYVVFKVVKKFFGPIKNPDGTEKSEMFAFKDVGSMAVTGVAIGLITKVFEVPFSMLSGLIYLFRKANADNVEATALVGIAGAALLYKGLGDMEEDQLKDGRISRLAKAEIIAGGTGLGAAFLRTLIRLPWAPPLPPLEYQVPAPVPSGYWDYLSNICGWESDLRWDTVLYGLGWDWSGKKTVSQSQDWSWTYLEAQGTASRVAVGIPLQILTSTLLKPITENKKIPKIVRTAITVLELATNVVASNALAAYLELPGAKLQNPYHTFASLALLIGIPKMIQLFTEDEQEVFPVPSPESMLLGKNIYLIPQANLLLAKQLDEVSQRIDFPFNKIEPGSK